MYQTGSKNLKLCLERVSLIDFHLIKYWWSEKWKFLFFFSWKSNRERERERERPVIGQWGGGEGSSSEMRSSTIAPQPVGEERWAPIIEFSEMSSDFEVCVREFSTCELWTKMVFVFVFFILTLFQGLKILGDIFYQGLWQSCLEKCLNSEGKIHAGELNVFLFF